MAPNRILVVDDSAFMRKVVSDLIEDDPQFTVIGTAKNGKEAIAKVKELQPDAVTMDVEMPEMNGLEALLHIMQDTPVPVIMLSSLTEEGARETIIALERGAVDFVRKPSGSVSLDVYKVKLLLQEKLRMAVKIRMSSKNALQAPSSGKASAALAVTPVKRTAVQEAAVVRKPAKTEESKQKFGSDKPAIPKVWPNPQSNSELPGQAAAANQTIPTHSRTKITKLVAIGTSTGGPRALNQVLSELPADFPAPIVIVQHMPPKFTHSLAERLDKNSQIAVTEASEGEELQTGKAYIAPGGWHLLIVKQTAGSYRVKLTKDEPRNGHRPSVDALFDSLLPIAEDLEMHAVVMTGMGSDGAKGMKALKEAGIRTAIAESEETCIVYGMPRAAVETQCVDYILPVTEIPRKLTELLMSR
ncbi:protein-glutamate methylesterase/protein-glutamine glutaminase [Paenibacillus gansuensis]|uniref:Protein-glutamate methylesterase/protein-glutamine glutaminase n=1 Tax=Paenibacillus gansuensis TaxID=306542 RepID=A0ABW5PDF5_9BACL